MDQKQYPLSPQDFLQNFSRTYLQVKATNPAKLVVMVDDNDNDEGTEPNLSFSSASKCKLHKYYFLFFFMNLQVESETRTRILLCKQLVGLCLRVFFSPVCPSEALQFPRLLFYLFIK